MQKEVTFSPPQAFNRQTLLDTLATHYDIQQEKTRRTRDVYYDTFDWRLFRHALVLYRTGNTLCLRSLDAPAAVGQVAIASPPVFVSDVPPSPVREALAPVVDMRALLKLFVLRARRTCIRILNDDAKTVVRLYLDEDTIVEPPGASRLPPRVLLAPVRGYDKHAKRLARWLCQNGFTPSPDDPYVQRLAAVNKQPGDYSTKVRVYLQPEQRADMATKMILRQLFPVMQRNEDGVKHDIDTECLHDFRVAIRRTRAALGQIKAVFPAEVTARFQKDFAYLTRTTNEVRDLDVYLLHKAAYQARLPAHIRPAIAPLFTHIQQQRSKAFNLLVRRLQAKRYADIIRRWQAFLESPPEATEAAANASRPIVAVARQRLEKKCRAVLKLGRRAMQEVDDEMLHAVRLECKKLRYLLEFFACLFPGKNTTRLIKHLRKLQDDLGRLHDLYVQQEALHRLAEAFSATDAQTRNTLRAIDYLIGSMDEEREALRQAFPKLFIAFAEQAGHSGFAR